MSWYSEQVFGGISGEAVNLVSRDALTEPLRPMEGQQWTEEKILECLNRNHRPKNPSDSALVYLKGKGLKGRVNFLDRLRTAIDDWIDSGYASGTDDPRRRAGAAEVAALNLHWTSASQPRRTRGAPGPGICLTLRLIPKHDDVQTGDRIAAECARVNDVLGHMFLLGLDRRIAKCRNSKCGMYFTLKKWRWAFRKGTRCDLCRKLVDTVASNDEQRESLKQVIREHVAMKFRKEILRSPKTDPWYSNRKLQQGIAHSINHELIRQLPEPLRNQCKHLYPDGVTSIWIARVDNWGPIGELVQGKPYKSWNKKLRRERADERKQVAQ
jgi:hypothetical protein